MLSEHDQQTNSMSQPDISYSVGIPVHEPTVFKALEIASRHISAVEAATERIENSLKRIVSQDTPATGLKTQDTSGGLVGMIDAQGSRVLDAADRLSQVATQLEELF